MFKKNKINNIEYNELEKEMYYSEILNTLFESEEDAKIEESKYLVKNNYFKGFSNSEIEKVYVYQTDYDSFTNNFYNFIFKKFIKVN